MGLLCHYVDLSDSGRISLIPVTKCKCKTPMNLSKRGPLPTLFTVTAYCSHSLYLTIRFLLEAHDSNSEGNVCISHLHCIYNANILRNVELETTWKNIGDMVRNVMALKSRNYKMHQKKMVKSGRPQNWSQIIKCLSPVSHLTGSFILSCLGAMPAKLKRRTRQSQIQYCQGNARQNSMIML